MTRKFIIATMALLAIIIAVFAFHNVSAKITDTDKEYIHLITESSGYDFEALAKNAHQNFNHEITFIRAMQDAILIKTPQQKRLKLRTSREPKRLYEINYAQCGDRSRFLEKALRLAGFETRYASIYSKKNTDYPLLKKGGDGRTSHALIEVKTSRGWMIVDSVVPWIGLTEEEQVVGLEDWENNKNSTWNSGQPYFLIQDDFIYIYGLYSRHGQFYPPYTPYIPDINWPDFVRYNLF